MLSAVSCMCRVLSKSFTSCNCLDQARKNVDTTLTASREIKVDFAVDDWPIVR